MSRPPLSKEPKAEFQSTRKRPAPARRPASAERAGQYVLPGLDLLNQDAAGTALGDPAEADRQRTVLRGVLDAFGIDAQVGPATSGPGVTLHEIIPALGVRVARFSRLRNDLCGALGVSRIRILTPIPGRTVVGIEVPSAKAVRVSVRSLLDSPAWRSSTARLPLLIGRSLGNEVVVLDLATAPHLLIAGATGSGTAACIDLLLLSLLYRFRPDELRLLLVGPQAAGFQAYASLPHLITPVISDVKPAHVALRWVGGELERRYRALASVGARHLEEFNARSTSTGAAVDESGEPIPSRLPYLVVVIGELADIMVTAKGEVVRTLVRLAQLSRAVGIHVILATRHPSATVITGIIRASFPTRIAFQVATQAASRAILDRTGAEALVGQGDMLLQAPAATGLQRHQGGMVVADEIERVVTQVVRQAEPTFDPRVLV